MRAAPIVFTVLATAVFVVALEAEGSVHLLAVTWLISAVVVLMLAICRFVVFGRGVGSECAIGVANGLAAEWRTRCDDWGMAMTGALIVTGFAFLYFLD